MKNLENLLYDKKLVPYTPTKKQIEDLLELITRDINDAAIPTLSIDRQFMSLYSASLLLVTIILHLEGYRTRGEAHHHTTFEAGQVLLPEDSDTIDYFDRCRRLRNKTEYERSGIISKNEIKSLRIKVKYFKNKVDKLTTKYIN